MEHDSVFILLLSLVIYFIAKPAFEGLKENPQENKRLITSFVLIGLLQVAYGLLQYADILPRLQDQFKIGGAFGNPGPYSNFVVSLLPFAVVAALTSGNNNSFLKYGGWITCILIVTVLPITKARASWIAALAGILFVLYYRFGWQVKLRRFLQPLWLKIVAVAGIILFVAIASVYLIRFKEASASGRLFIWKITTRAISDKPLFGFGYEKYMSVHNDYQATYFMEGDFSKEEADLADSISYAFNEYLQYTAETGVVGLLLFLAVIWFALSRLFRREKDEKLNSIELAARASLLVILITSLFSYPLRTLPNNVLFYLVLSMLSANEPEVIRIINVKEKTRKVLSLAGIVMLVIFLTAQIKKYNAAKDWLEAFRMVRSSNYKQAKEQYAQLYPVLNHNPYFLFNYGAELSVMGDYRKSTEILDQAKPLLNDADVYIYLGNSYDGLGLYPDAVTSFTQASLIMPVKFYPKYRLTKIYLKTGEQAKAKELARQILDMQVKIPSDIVTGIRNEMEQLLEENNDPPN